MTIDMEYPIQGGETVSVLGRDQGYTVKYSPLSEGVPEGKSRRKSRRNSQRQRAIFDRTSRVESQYGQYMIFMNI